MSSQPLVPVVEHLPDGIVQIALPTPFPVGPVNCYVLLDDPVTIVDPGLLWADSVGRLEEAMNLMGRRLVDVEQVLVTHGHPDHFGAAGWLAEKADATVACGRAERPKLVDVWGSHLGSAVVRLGIPDAIHDVVRTFSDGIGHIAHPIAEDRLVLLDDGDTLTGGGRDWQVHVTPGHSVGHVALFDPLARVLLSGDHLLACITPNPVLEPDADSPDGRRRSLVEYLASLDRFVRLDPLLVLPGHGPSFCDVPTLATVTRRNHERRADEVFEFIRRLGPATPFELSREMFPHIKDFSVILGVSEAVGHLDLLEDDGRLVRSTDVASRYAIA